jgi:hypothetical protein
MTFRNDVLGVLWSGKGKAVSDREAAAFRELLATLYPGRTILIGVEDGAMSERALLDDIEVMPSLSLGDVVAEELNISVPYGTVMAFVPISVFSAEACERRQGEVLGRVYAQIVLDSLHRGNFPMDREMGVLLGLCDTALASVGRIEGEGGRICTAAFERALSTTLCAAMSGGGQDAARCGSLAELRHRYGATVEGDVATHLGGHHPLSFQGWLSALAPSQDRKPGPAGAEDVLRLRATKI